MDEPDLFLARISAPCINKNSDFKNIFGNFSSKCFPTLHLGTSRTAFRHFVYRDLIDDGLVKRVVTWLENWCKKPELIPTDISDLSFWATGQIPNSSKFKALIMAQSSPEIRLMVCPSFFFLKYFSTELFRIFFWNIFQFYLKEFYLKDFLNELFRIFFLIYFSFQLFKDFSFELLNIWTFIYELFQIFFERFVKWKFFNFLLKYLKIQVHMNFFQFCFLKDFWNELFIWKFINLWNFQMNFSIETFHLKFFDLL